MYLAVSAGVLATSGSLFGKLAGSVGTDFTIEIILKIFFLVMMVAANTAGCSCFVKALQKYESSLPTTIASAATNYFCSALVGYLIFGESTSLTWWCGTSLVLLGLLLVCCVPTKDTCKIAEKDKAE